MPRIEVNGCLLAVDSFGEGGPPVVFVSGCGDSSDVWDKVRGLLESLGLQLVTYDRPGTGLSAPLPDPSAAQTYLDAARELHGLLSAAGVPTPRVLVGHSVGAVIAQSYAMNWPDDTAGLVLVDSSDLRLDMEIDQPELTFRDGSDSGGRLFDVLAGIREIEAGQLPTVPAAVVTSRVGRWVEEGHPEAWRPFTLEQLDERWQLGQRMLAEKLHARHIVAKTAGHYVHKEEPVLVAEAIKAVVDEVSSLHA
ncbi:alpha/beta hydrolase [Kribbella sp. NPDC026611]|uniref:alpha/beta fold hydrolase n=1 Tax=Kribbella sp. NPDC026611 TaxID=3154911 RepID=UPI0033D470FE